MWSSRGYSQLHLRYGHVGRAPYSSKRRYCEKHICFFTDMDRADGLSRWEMRTEVGGDVHGDGTTAGKLKTTIRGKPSTWDLCLPVYTMTHGDNYFLGTTALYSQGHGRHIPCSLLHRIIIPTVEPIINFRRCGLPVRSEKSIHL